MAIYKRIAHKGDEALPWAAFGLRDRGHCFRCILDRMMTVDSKDLIAVHTLLRHALDGEPLVLDTDEGSES